MDIYHLFTLIAATFAGASMGSFLMVTLLYNTHLKNKKNINDSLFIYRRLYRLNSILCLLAGLCAALIKDHTATLMLTILTVSYVFNLSHILKGLTKACDEQYNINNDRTYQSFTHLQNLLHLSQFAGAGYAIYLLALNY